MRNLIAVAVFLLSFTVSFSQKTKVPPKKYPSLLWEITGNGLTKPSYLFGTMHVSSKMVFHLSDSFYLGIKNADVVALETDMSTWQEDFSRYDMEGEGMYNYFSRWRNGFGSPGDFLTQMTLQFPSYEKMIESALYSSPSIINNFLYRSNSERTSDFEEDTYLDMHIFQAGKKWGKKVTGVENFDRSMELMKEAYVDAAKEKDKKQRSYDYDQEFSYNKLEDAYRTGNLDLLDTINKVNSTSAAFDEKFLYKRNEIQAGSIDSILRTKSALFVGVGAAHLPGERGVIELLRKKGYKLRPIKMTERDSRHKDEVEKIRVPIQFTRQTSPDGFFSVSMPGKLYEFTRSYGPANQEQFADMSNGSYYMVTRINTNTVLWGHDEATVLRKIDSVIYENVPGKILTKQVITKNGYKGVEVINKTRRGDFQRYNIFVTPFEVILFKMSGNGEYVTLGKEADQFFNSIELKEYKNEWKKWSPSFGGFEVELPHEPVLVNEGNWQFMANDKQTGTGFEIIRTDIHNYDFVEEDTFDLNLMEESFASSDFIDKQLSRKQTKVGGYSALDTKYKFKDGSLGLVRFLIQGTHYYTLVAHAKTDNPKMTQFLNSFVITPFIYNTPQQAKDTSLYYSVNTPVPLEKTKKISMMPENLYMYGGYQDEDAQLTERGVYKDKLIANDSTGEKIYVSFSKQPRYYWDSTTVHTDKDSTHFKTDKINWTYRSRKKYELPNKMKVFEYVLGDPKSSRYLRGKSFTRDGVTFTINTDGDTLSRPSTFVTSFFDSFQPSDTVKGINIREKKTTLFFSDFFSTDTSLHKRAVKNVNQVDFDSSDFNQLKKVIGSLTWKEKKYMDVKKDFVWQLASVKSKESSDYLKNIYFAAGDTIDLQYTALQALLAQKTAYSYQAFKDIMVTDPPVLDLSGGNSNFGSRSEKYTRKMYISDYSSYTDDDDRSGSFFEGLTDSLQLTASIFKDLLPLININDYEQPMMDLMGTLVDSNIIAAKDYEMYQPKFLIEAKQLLKKQIINEKNKSIEKAQQDDEEKKNNGGDEDEDYGNSQLSLYATLLMPFWDKNPAISQLASQLISSNDKRLKYNTAMLLLRNKKALPDSLLKYFAGLDEYRYDLYTSLKEQKQLALFPAAYNNQVDLARSKLLSNNGSYDKPDSIVFVDKLPVQYKDRSGYVYYFKYKQKKDDNAWRLATVGIVPADPKQFEFERKEKYYEEQAYNFTEPKGTKIEPDEPIKEQMKKMLKKMQYSKRNSAAQFYQDEDNMGMGFLKNMNIRD
jgi:uncharacterized protein YbaP (TraB family)